MTWLSGFTSTDRANLNRVLALVQSQQTAIATLTGRVSALTSDQSHLDQDVQQLQADETANASALQNVAQEIANLKNQPGAQALDFTALDQAVAQAGTQTGQLQGLESPAPASPPATPPAPSA